MRKPREKTREELQAEIEDGKKKIRQFENREKMLRQKLSKEERRTRSHRLIVRGAVFESIVPEAKDMTDEEATVLLRLALTSEPAREFLKKRAEESDTPNKSLGTKGALIHPCGRVRSAEGLSRTERKPLASLAAPTLAALPQQGAAPLAPLTRLSLHTHKTVHPPLAPVPFLRVLLSYPGGDTHSHLPLEHRHCEPRKRQISRCRSRLPQRRKADKRVGRNDPRLHPQRRRCPYRNHAAAHARPLSLTVQPCGTAWSFTRKPGTPSLPERLTQRSPLSVQRGTDPACPGILFLSICFSEECA